MSESRTELIAWYNDLGQENFTKVEQFGTGSAHCLIMDSIFRDVFDTHIGITKNNKVPLHKVKFKAKHEWEYVANFKVLQATFDKHKIDNSIPVEKLIKCKFQDNLEFLQWIKKYSNLTRFWDQYYPGGTYVRKQGVPETPKKVIKAKSVGTIAAAAGPIRDLASDYEKVFYVNSWYYLSNKVTRELNKQVTDLKQAILQTQKEKEFYYGKLREIEVYIQARIEGGAEVDFYKDIQSILYKTEDGFEVPDDE